MKKAKIVMEQVIILFAAMRRNVVPQAIEPFNAYIIAVYAYLQANQVRLGVTDANMKVLSILINDSVTGWIQLHTLHSSTSTRTGDVNTDLANSESIITHLLESIYHDIPRSVMITADYSTLHIAKLSNTKSARAKIENIPFAKMYSTGGAIIRWITRPLHSAGKAHIDPLADELQVEGILLNAADALPTDISQCNIHFSSKHAIFSHTFSPSDAGKRFACFVRYANTSDDKKSGGWSGIIICIVAF